MMVMRRTPFLFNKKKTRETLGRCGDLSPEISRDLSPEISRDSEHKENQAD
jgi:hypothetical protein